VTEEEDRMIPTALAANGTREARPAESHAPGWSKVTVVLLNRQIVYLDRLSASIRDATGSVIRRAEIIRTLVDLLAEAGVDLAEIRSSDDLKRILRGHLS
jgi:hypothetical protein